MQETSAQKTKLEMVTTRRQDLFDISRLLARGLNDPDLLSDPARPVTVYVSGSYDAGKKIFPDAVRRELLGPDHACLFSGKLEYDEYWADKAKTREVSFINAAWSPCQFSDYFRRFKKSELLDSFNRTRRSGGIAFIHNAEEMSSGALHIYLERTGGSDNKGWTIRAENSRLSDAFAKANHVEMERGVDFEKLWSRYIEITVLDDRLLHSQGFMDALQTLSRGAKKVSDALTHYSARREVQPLAKYLGLDREKLAIFKRNG